MIFYTVAQLSRELTRLHHEGYPLDVTRLPEPLEYDLPIFSTASQ